MTTFKVWQDGLTQAYAETYTNDFMDGNDAAETYADWACCEDASLLRQECMYVWVQQGDGEPREYLVDIVMEPLFTATLIEEK